MIKIKPMYDGDEKEAGTPYVNPGSEAAGVSRSSEAPVKLNDVGEVEAGAPYVNPRPVEAEPFDAAKEYERIVGFLRPPDDYEKQKKEAAGKARTLETVGAIGLLLDIVKGAFGGTIQKRDHSALQKAQDDLAAYEAAAAKDAKRYDGERRGLMKELYDRTTKETEANRSYQRELDKILLQGDIKTGHIKLQGDIAERNKLSDRESEGLLQDAEYRWKTYLERIKYGNGLAEKKLAEELKREAENNKPYIDVPSPFGLKSRQSLTTGEAIQFYSWLENRPEVSREDMRVYGNALSMGGAPSQALKQIVVKYSTMYPEALAAILADSGKAPTTYAPEPEPIKPSWISRDIAKVRSRSSTKDDPPKGKGNPLLPRN